MLRRSNRRASRGFSLLDTLAAGTVMAIALVPGYTAMRSGLELSRDAAALQITTTLCVTKMEEHLAVVASSFTTLTETGNFAADGFSKYEFSVTCSDDPLDGGIADRLMAITVTVWRDDDGDDVLDNGEIKTELFSKVAKMATYVTG